MLLPCVEHVISERACYRFALEALNASSVLGRVGGSTGRIGLIGVTAMTLSWAVLALLEALPRETFRETRPLCMSGPFCCEPLPPLLPAL